MTIIEQRKAYLLEADQGIESAILALAKLVASYPESDGPYSGCHPRQAYASMLKSLQQLKKSTSRGRV